MNHGQHSQHSPSFLPPVIPPPPPQIRTPAHQLPVGAVQSVGAASPSATSSPPLGGPVVGSYTPTRSLTPVAAVPPQQFASHQRYVPGDVPSPNLLSPQNNLLSPHSFPIPPPPPPTSAVSLRAPLLPSPCNGPSSPARSVALSPCATFVTSPLSVRGNSQAMMVGYNPQNWSNAGPSGFMPHSAIASRNVDPDEGVSSPPPPYTPAAQRLPDHISPPPIPQDAGRYGNPYLQTPAQHPSISQFTSPISAVSPASSMRTTILSPAGSTGNPPSFPPPPGTNNTRDRSASRSGRSRFGLSALTRGISTDRSNTSHTPDAPIPRDMGARTVSATNLAHRAYNPGSVNPPASHNRMSVYVTPTQVPLEAPSARRSASAGAMSHHLTSTPSQTNAPSWERGLPLPPPPPGPPPAGSRSASASGHHRNGSIQLGDQLVPILSMPSRRPRHERNQTFGSLGPVPPTPAGWVETFDQRSTTPRAQADSTASEDSVDQSDTSSSERLSRRDDMSTGSSGRGRDSTVKPLRERRSESKAARDRVLSPDGEAPTTAIEAKLADLTLNLINSNLSRQGAMKKNRDTLSPRNLPSPRHQNGQRTSESGLPTPLSSALPQSSTSYKNETPGLPPKALPTPPPTEKDGLISGHPRSRQSSAVGKRRATDWLEPSGDAELDSFARESWERHQAFIEQERSATSDRQRLELFAEYIVMESRLRRDRYSVAFSSMASDVFDMTRDLWRPLQRPPASEPPSAKRISTGHSTPQPRAQPTRQDSSDSYDTSPASGNANWTPRTESESPSSVGSAGPREANFKSFKPMLSPIPSMAMSTVPDAEDDSRGRTTSRWWESDTGSVGGGRLIERSARESKYMGLHKEARYNLQFQDQDSPALPSGGTPGRSVMAGSSSEYPPEKVGWHEPIPQETLPLPPYSVPTTPSATPGIDFQRLITLPPSYPRHYPALSNAHPDLADVRNTIRILNEIKEVSTKKDAYANKIKHQRAIAAQNSAARTAQLRHNVQEQVRHGQMSYADAAAAEEAFNIKEIKDKQAALRKEFDDFQPEVITPLHALLTEKVDTATKTIGELRDSLSTSATESSPEAPMEEGDERPELLEKLKNLHRLVVARETLHRELFNLESERCDKYRDLIVADLKGRGEPPDSVLNAQQFFDKDQTDRWKTFETEARSRLEKLLSVIEVHVNRGVQVQLSAFYDLCPGLNEILSKVPSDPTRLSKLKVSIPHAELIENPEYVDYPLRYLYGLLVHAEKASYQFIENQTGLWCLSNEIGLTVMRASLTVVRAERCAEEGRGRDDEELVAEMASLGEFEEQSLSRQLKDRVAEVESQWKEALGSTLSACIEGVEFHLRETNAWDDSLRG